MYDLIYRAGHQHMHSLGFDCFTCLYIETTRLIIYYIINISVELGAVISV
jgi:hypothetical protein